MDKDVAILTLYYRNANYGAVLQAFALQKAIELCGGKAKQISYDLHSGYDTIQRSRTHIIAAHLYHYAKYKKWMIEYRKREKLLFGFADKIPHTEKVTASTINSLSKYYDIFICGSDQIWNPMGWQPSLFLDFLPDGKKRASYAASVAREKLSEEELAYMGNYLEKFDYISVRETNTAYQLNNHFKHLRVEVMPDPVFLLNQMEWEKMAENGKEKRNSYVLAYWLSDDSQYRDDAIKYAVENNKDIYFISHMNWNFFDWENRNQKYLTGAVGAEGFLALIKNADLVITDSFHASAFSSIFNVPFVIFERRFGSKEKSMSTRIETLLRELNCMDRTVTKLSSCQNYCMDEWEKNVINSNIERLRTMGMSYLHKIME